jgi:hypothetical protein
MIVLFGVLSRLLSQDQKFFPSCRLSSSCRDLGGNRAEITFGDSYLKSVMNNSENNELELGIKDYSQGRFASHEFGHMMGLRHNFFERSIMNRDASEEPVFNDLWNINQK